MKLSEDLSEISRWFSKRAGWGGLTLGGSDEGFPKTADEDEGVPNNSWKSGGGGWQAGGGAHVLGLLHVRRLCRAVWRVKNTRAGWGGLLGSSHEGFPKICRRVALRGTVRAPPTTAGSQTAAVSRREEEFVYWDYFMYGVFVEL